MNLLLDTHVLLWWLDDDPTLSPEVRAAIGDGANDVYVSSATAWEIAIKRALGKLEVPDNLEEALSAAALQELPISVAHAMETGGLPAHHSDPFDRMLVAQARLEGLTLVTRDANITKYSVPLLRA